jgi:hypothetical protein
MTQAEIIDRLMNYWQRRFGGMVKGQRNTNLLKLAHLLNEHGIPMNDALSACLPMQDNTGTDPFTASEIRSTIASAYRKSVAGSNPWMSSTDYRPPPPPPPPRRMPSHWILKPDEREALVRAFAQALQQAPPPAPLPPPPAAVTPPPPVATTPPASPAEQLLERMTQRNPALKVLFDACDIGTPRLMP